MLAVLENIAVYKTYFAKTWLQFTRHCRTQWLIFNLYWGCNKALKAIPHSLFPNVTVLSVSWFLPLCQLCKHMWIILRWHALFNSRYLLGFISPCFIASISLRLTGGHKELTSQFFIPCPWMIWEWLDPIKPFSPIKNETDNNRPLIF